MSDNITTRKHWKIYRGDLNGNFEGVRVYWSASEAGIKKALREARAENPDEFNTPGTYSYVYIEPTKHGVIDWLERNLTHDNG